VLTLAITIQNSGKISLSILIPVSYFLVGDRDRNILQDSLGYPLLPEAHNLGSGSSSGLCRDHGRSQHRIKL
jgi:hypothetical protein